MAINYNILKAVEYGKLSAGTRKKYPNVQALVDAGWWVQRKYDGVFGQVEVMPGGLSFLHTRTGERIHSADHIVSQVLDTAPLHLVKAGFRVLGELWHPSLPFPTISGDVRRHRDSPHLKFVINDLLPSGMVTEESYSDRFARLASVWPHGLAPDLMLVKRRSAFLNHNSTPVESWAAALVKEGGYDGAILRDPNAGYTVGTASAGQIVKVKPKLTLDLRVQDVLMNLGEITGRKVYTVNVHYRGVRTTVGAGMPHTYAELPKQGSIVEIECLGLTADGKLREPVYKGIRHDKLEPDT